MFHLKILCVLFKATSFLDRNNDGCDYFAQFLVSLIDFLIAINNVNSGYVITLLALLCSAEQPDHNVQVEFLLKCSIQGASPLIVIVVRECVTHFNLAYPVTLRAPKLDFL